MSRASISRDWKIREIEPSRFGSGPCRFEPWSSQTSDFKIDTCRFLIRHSALLGERKDWLARCQDNLTGWASRAWCWQPSVPVRQHYSHHECVLSQFGTCLDMTLDVART